MTTRRALVTVDLNALETNYRAIRSLVPTSVKTLCVIKADAYGHGAVQVARRYVTIGVDYFGLATVEEGVQLRESGISTPLLILGGIMPWEETARALRYRLTPVVTGIEMLKKIAEETTALGASVNVHLKVDTGMGRLGIRPEEVPVFVEELSKWKQVCVEGVMSHFSSSEKRDEYGLTQMRAFGDIVEALKGRGIVPTIVHMANSGAVCTYPEAHFSMVRLGIMLYGSYPDPVLSTQIALEPVMRLSSGIAAIRDFPSGSALSYGRTFITDREMRIASIPLGYADGYPRALSNKGSVLIQGKRCRLVGRVCMDWLLVDVTGMAGVQAGDEVVFLGRDQNQTITADEIAQHAGTIPYEILCGISPRIPRIHV